MNRLKTYLWTLIAAIGVVAAIFLFSHGAGGIASFRPAIDLYAEDTDYQALTAFDLIYADYYASLGCFAEEETTTKNRIGQVVSQSSTYYYAVPVFSGEDTYWIGLEVAKENDVDMMDEITDATYDYLAGELDDWGDIGLSKYGSLHKMNKEMYGYMVEAFEELGYDSEEMSQYVLPVYISTFVPENMQKMFVVAVGALLVCVVLLILWVRALIRRRKEKEKYRESWENPQMVGYGGSSTGEAMIKVCGNAYPKRFFYRVNTYVQNNDLENARQELRNVTGITQYQAEDVIAHWKDYYSE